MSATAVQCGSRQGQAGNRQAEYGAGSTQKDVTEVLRKQAGDLPLITLASSSYNASFGGDPVPGSVKQLKIQYRINGKTGEASFRGERTDHSADAKVNRQFR